MKRTYLIDFIIILMLVCEFIVTRNLIYALFLLLFILLFVAAFITGLLSAQKKIDKARMYQSQNEFDKAAGALLCLPLDTVYERKKRRALNDERLVTILLSGDVNRVKYIIQGYKGTKEFSLLVPVASVVSFLSQNECTAVFSGKKHPICVINDAIYFFQKGDLTVSERLCTQLQKSDITFYKWFCAYMKYRISVLNSAPDTDERDRALTLSYNTFMKNVVSVAGKSGGLQND